MYAANRYMSRYRYERKLPTVSSTPFTLNYRVSIQDGFQKIGTFSYAL